MEVNFQYEDKSIVLELIFRKRKTMSIYIEGPGRVRVIAPQGLTKEYILEKIRGKGSWIFKKLEELDRRRLEVRKREFITGEKFPFLGQDYTLEVIECSMDHKPQIGIHGQKLVVKTPNLSREYLRKSLVIWYKDQLEKVIRERIKDFQQFFMEKPTSIVVKDQKRRWASCTSQRKLLFNWRLALAPMVIIDYIIVHEMSHMVHMNHSREYWSCVGDIIPDYKERRKWLKDHGMSLDLS